MTTSRREMLLTSSGIVAGLAGFGTIRPGELADPLPMKLVIEFAGLCAFARSSSTPGDLGAVRVLLLDVLKLKSKAMAEMFPPHDPILKIRKADVAALPIGTPPLPPDRSDSAFYRVPLSGMVVELVLNGATASGPVMAVEDVNFSGGVLDLCISDENRNDLVWLARAERILTANPKPKQALLDNPVKGTVVATRVNLAGGMLTCDYPSDPIFYKRRAAFTAGDKPCEQVITDRVRYRSAASPLIEIKLTGGRLTGSVRIPLKSFPNGEATVWIKNEPSTAAWPAPDHSHFEMFYDVLKKAVGNESDYDGPRPYPLAGSACVQGTAEPEWPVYCPPIML